MGARHNRSYQRRNRESNRKAHDDDDDDDDDDGSLFESFCRIEHTKRKEVRADEGVENDGNIMIVDRVTVMIWLSSLAT